MSYVQVSAALPTLSGLSQSPAPQLSQGQYGIALSRVTIPARAVQLLRLASTFMKMVKTLDASYVDHRRWIALQEKNPSLKLDANFRVAGGSLRGRRILYVAYDPAGSLFIPGQSIDSPTGWDIIRFSSSLKNDDVIGWIQAVAHETAHAFARVKAKGPGPSKAVDRVRAAVSDECNTRRVEQKVVKEIRATAAGRKAFADEPPARPVRTCDCERDWFPSAQKRTYLEHFVLGMDWETAARGLDSKAVEKIIADVAAIPLQKTLPGHKASLFLTIMRGAAIAPLATQFPVLESPAGQAAFVLRLVDHSWRQLIGKVGQSSNIWDGVKELRLKRHVRLFFKIPVSYTPCP